jgi:hypothetical protein
MSRKAPKKDAAGNRLPGFLRRSLPLQPGESVLQVSKPSLASTWPKYVATLGLYGIWRRRRTTILTNHRLLLNSGLVRHSERSIPISRIRDAHFERKGLVGYTELVMSDAKKERIGPVPPKQARRLASEIISEL